MHWAGWHHSVWCQGSDPPWPIRSAGKQGWCWSRTPVPLGSRAGVPWPVEGTHVGVCAFKNLTSWRMLRRGSAERPWSGALTKTRCYTALPLPNLAYQTSGFCGGFLFLLYIRGFFDLFLGTPATGPADVSEKTKTIKLLTWRINPCNAPRTLSSRSPSAGMMCLHTPASRAWQGARRRWRKQGLGVLPLLAPHHPQSFPSSCRYTLWQAKLRRKQDSADRALQAKKRLRQKRKRRLRHPQRWHAWPPRWLTMHLWQV